MKNWLIKNFLPMWAKETVLWENRGLRLENERLRQKICMLEQYIQGVHRGLRGRERKDV